MSAGARPHRLVAHHVRCPTADSAGEERDLDREPCAGAAFRFDVEGSVDGRDSLAHPDEPEPATVCLRWGETTSVVFDRENEGPFAAGENDAHLVRLGMLDDVRQRFLRDPKDGGLELGRQSPPAGRATSSSTLVRPAPPNACTSL